MYSTKNLFSLNMFNCRCLGFIAVQHDIKNVRTIIFVLNIQLPHPRNIRSNCLLWVVMYLHLYPFELRLDIMHHYSLKYPFIHHFIHTFYSMMLYKYLLPYWLAFRNASYYWSTILWWSRFSINHFTDIYSMYMIFRIWRFVEDSNLYLKSNH